MKKYMCIVGLVCLVTVGCTSSQTIDPVASGTEVTTVTREEYNRLEVQGENLGEELKEVRGYFENDPSFFLNLMDQDLDAVEQGREARGSFSDYFVPNAAKALAAGASKKDVAVRFDRLIALAEKKVYLSGFVAELMEKGGAAAVRTYADEWMRGQ